MLIGVVIKDRFDCRLSSEHSALAGIAICVQQAIHHAKSSFATNVIDLQRYITNFGSLYGAHGSNNKKLRNSNIITNIYLYTYVCIYIYMSQFFMFFI